MPEAQGASVEKGRADRVEARGLAGVHGDGEELRRQVVERLAVPRRREAVLGPGDVEAGGAAAPVRHGELRDLERAVGVAHRRDQLADADAAAAALGAVLGLLDAGLNGFHRLLEREAARQVLLGRPAHLAVDDAVLDEVLARTPGRRGSVPRASA